MSIPPVSDPFADDPRTLGWEHVHAQVCRLAQQKNAYEVDEARWLLAAWTTRVHEPSAAW